MENKPARDQFKALDKRLPFKSPEAIQPELLECFPYEYAGKPVGKDMEIVTETAEFTSVCPFSGLPDFARVILTYTPAEKCLELRSLKYYLLSYRDVGIWYEHLVNRMLEDLVHACQPRKMKLVIECNTRGGLSSTVSAEYKADQV
jgi:7-cyano-7-deazaguanine reductase